MGNTKFIQEPSAFAQMVDKLRNKSEAELKLLYLRFFKNDISNDWKEITKGSGLKKISEGDIIKALQKKRYHG